MDLKVIALLVVMVLTFIGIIIGFDPKVVGETPCVDGQNRVNLEGIMCEKIETTWFGLHGNYSLLACIPLFIIFILFLKDLLKTWDGAI